MYWQILAMFGVARSKNLDMWFNWENRIWKPSWMIEFFEYEYYVDDVKIGIWHVKGKFSPPNAYRWNIREYTSGSKGILTYLLTLWSSVLLEKLTGSQIVKKLQAFYGTRRFITAFTSVRHLPLS
jgi:hypothetical protein